MNSTNNFDLKTKNASGVTLAQAYCDKYPEINKQQMMVSVHYFCAHNNASLKNEYLFSAEYSYSQQEFECVEGMAIISDEIINDHPAVQPGKKGAAAHLYGKISVISSLFTMLIFFANQFA